jgi:pyridoxal phosphate enzyme (YggS family)
VTTALDPEIEADVAARVADLRRRIAGAAARAGRDPAEVTLVGAAKRQPIERVAAAVAAGVHDLGHNYAQEARTMRDALEARLLELGAGAPPIEIRWRMIGHLQSNKAALAVECFDCIDAVDSAKLARALDRRAGRAGRRLELGLQVNLTGEPQKSGVSEAELPSLLEACADLEHVDVVSLMTMPAASEDPEAARPVFSRLRVLRDGLRDAPGGQRLEQLSMGMSGDFEIAVEEGATLVRLGTALFGERAPR